MPSISKQKLTDSFESSPRLNSPVARFNLLQGLTPQEYLMQAIASSQQDPAELWQRVESKIPETETIQGVEFRRFNWERFDPTKPVLVQLLGFEATLQKGSIAYQGYKIAEACEMPMISFNTPGTGRSVVPNKSARARARIGVFSGIMEGPTKVLRECGVELINIVGFSFGSELAMGLAIAAADQKIKVEKVFVMASPSELKRSRRQLLNAEKVQQALYTSDHLHPYNGEHVGAYGYGESFLGGIALELADLGRYFRHPGVILDYAKGMSMGSALDQRTEAMNRHPNLDITIGVLTNDTVAPAGSTLENAQRLKREFPNRVSYFMLHGEDHGFEDQTERYAHFVKKVLASKTSSSL
ncbi:alpha/beta hydrolase [Candidatus Saccharibacteria bacterium]|nr:alpha/beta hydrolase [Candidatus Saccharibacteria bacterium]MCB9820993.1 alpha/beta hydrolase [Candidatus Nomurabacteria bacterium]